jgi:hypothetical protein
VPNLIHLPPGCKFAPRCPYAKEFCTQETPPLLEVTPGHQVRCYMRHPGARDLWAGVGRADWHFEGDEVLVETVA